MTAADEPSASRTRVIRILAVQVLVSTALIALILSRVSLAQVLGQARQIRLGTWMLGLAAGATSWLLEAQRLRVLARCVGHRMPYARALHINLVSNVYGFVLFGWLGGGGYRAWRFSREGWGFESSLLVLVADRALGIGSLGIATAIVLGIAHAAPGAAPWVLPVVLAVAAALAALCLGAEGNAPERLAEIAEPQTSRWMRMVQVTRLLATGGPRPLLGCLALGVLACASGFAWSVLTARDLGIAVPWLEMTGIVGLVSLAQQIPVSWLGTGVRESSYEFLLTRRGAAPGAGVALGSAQLGVMLAWVGLSVLTHLLVPASAPAPKASDQAEPTA